MRDISELFARQDGLATTAQLYELGLTVGLVRQRVASGEWERLDSRVVGVASTPVTWRRQVRASLLAAGQDAATVSHSTAARLHGFDGFGTATELHLTAFGRHVTSLTTVRVHRSTMLQRRDCCVIDGLVCVSRPIALVQIAATHGREGAAQALDGMLRDGDSPTWIRQVAAAWRRPRVPGPAVVLDLLDERVDGRLPRSWFQRVAHEVLRARGVVLVHEHPVSSPDGRALAELDLAMPDLRIGVECQSWRWHGTPAAQLHDARRKRRLRLLGWELVEVWWADLPRIDEIVAEVLFLVDRRVEAGLLP